MLNSGELDKVFKALSDATRRAMVERLVRGPVSVSRLAEPFAMSLPAVHQHLAVLEDAGIVTSHKLGRVRTVQLAADALAPAGDWLGRQQLPAERRLDRLGAFLAGHGPDAPDGLYTSDTPDGSDAPGVRGGTTGPPHP